MKLGLFAFLFFTIYAASILACRHHDEDGIKYVGCFTDWLDRTLSEKVIQLGSNNSPKKCAEHCVTEGYHYIGVEDKGQCFCGNTINFSERKQLTGESCQFFKCGGDNSTYCGGKWRIAVYATHLATDYACIVPNSSSVGSDNHNDSKKVVTKNPEIEVTTRLVEVVTEVVETTKKSEEESDNRDDNGDHINANSKCHNAADIAFVVDSSESVGSDNFKRIKEAIVSTVRNMDIGQSANQSRVGLVLFSPAKKIFGYEDHTDFNSLETAINNTVYLNSGTDIAFGMGTAINDIIYEKGRPGIPQYMVVITGGKDESDVKHANYMSRILNTTVIAVGIGNSTDDQQLGAIAGRSIFDYKYNDVVFHADNFDAVTQALTKMCNKLGRDGDTCKNVVDVVFVVEPSQTVGRENFDKVKQGINSIVATLDVGSGKRQSRIGLFTASSSSNNVFGLDAHSTVESVQRAVNNFQYNPTDTHNTYVSTAMRAAVGLYNRPQVRKVMVVFTDATDDSQIKNAEDYLIAENIFFIPVAIGEDAYENLDIWYSKIHKFTDVENNWTSLIPVCDNDTSRHPVAPPGFLIPGIKPYEYKPLHSNGKR